MCLYHNMWYSHVNVTLGAMYKYGILLFGIGNSNYYFLNWTFEYWEFGNCMGDWVVM